MVGGRNLELGLQQGRVRVSVDQPDVVSAFFSQDSGDIEAECRSRGRWFHRGKSDVPHRGRFMLEEKLPD
jgi:hypothetical protein